MFLILAGLNTDQIAISIVSVLFFLQMHTK